MLLVLAKYVCQNCKKEFHSPVLPGNPYGEFLLRDGKGNFRYLNAFENTVFSEVSTFIENHEKTKKLSDMDQAKLLHYIYGVTVDCNEGDIFSMLKNPICHFCGAGNVLFYGPIEPLQPVDEEIEAVSHLYWNSLNQEEKEKILISAIERYYKK